MKKGFGRGLLLEFGYWIGICTVVLLIRNSVLKLFVTGEGAEAIAGHWRSVSCGYGIFLYLSSLYQGFQGFYRGMGMMKMTLLGTFIQTSLRVIFTMASYTVPGNQRRGLCLCRRGGALCFLLRFLIIFIYNDR